MVFSKSTSRKESVDICTERYLLTQGKILLVHMVRSTQLALNEFLIFFGSKLLNLGTLLTILDLFLCNLVNILHRIDNFLLKIITQPKMSLIFIGSRISNEL